MGLVMSDENKSNTQETFELGDTIEIPAQFMKALANDESANSAFDKLSTAAQRKFIDWVAEAKESEERTQRSKQAIEKLKSGDPLND